MNLFFSGNHFKSVEAKMQVQAVQDLYIRYEPMVKLALRVGPVFGGAVILAWRVRETRVPVTRRSIVIPPFAMSTGFGMFFAPMMRIPWSWAMASVIAGALLLSLPLIHSTQLEPRDGVVFMRRSRAFLWILLGLLALRLALHDYVGRLISPLQTAAVFYLLAFGMIVRWRMNMYRKYTVIVGSEAASAA